MLPVADAVSFAETSLPLIYTWTSPVLDAVVRTSDFGESDGAAMAAAPGIHVARTAAARTLCHRIIVSSFARVRALPCANAYYDTKLRRNAARVLL